MRADIYRRVMEWCSWICHQDPERSLSIGDVQMPLCYRCLGIYGALLLTVVVLCLIRHAPSDRRFYRGRNVLVLSGLLLAADVYVVQAVWFNNATRFLSGLVLGASLGYFMWQCLAILLEKSTRSTSVEQTRMEVRNASNQ